MDVDLGVVVTALQHADASIKTMLVRSLFYKIYSKNSTYLACTVVSYMYDANLTFSAENLACV
jgi:hypothetical protein